MLMPETFAATSMMQVAWLVLVKIATSELVGTWPADQLSRSLQTPSCPPACQTFGVESRQRSSRTSSRGRKRGRGFRKEKPECFLVRDFLALNMVTSGASWPATD